MDNERCETCRFWRRGYRQSSDFTMKWETNLHRYTAAAPDSLVLVPAHFGACRRQPPIINGGQEWSQPRALADDWCGEFQPIGIKPDAMASIGSEVAGMTSRAFGGE